MTGHARDFSHGNIFWRKPFIFYSHKIIRSICCPIQKHIPVIIIIFLLYLALLSSFLGLSLAKQNNSSNVTCRSLVTSKVIN